MFCTLSCKAYSDAMHIVSFTVYLLTYLLTLRSGCLLRSICGTLYMYYVNYASHALCLNHVFLTWPGLYCEPVMAHPGQTWAGLHLHWARSWASLWLRWARSWASQDSA